MRDMKLVDFDEPVKNLLTQGMVIGESYYSEAKASYIPPDEVRIERDERGKIRSAALSSDGSPVRVAVEKMSKSKYNGVDPDEMINGSGLDEGYGADATRLFVLFAAPAENELVWKEEGVEGTKRFLQKIWRFVYRWHSFLQTGLQTGANATETADAKSPEARKLRRKTHQTIKRVTESFESYQFNTPVAALMELSNALGDFKIEPNAASQDELFAVKEAVQSLILMLTPYAPHVAEELWEVLTGSGQGILASGASFPKVDENLAKADEIEIPIQVNGKLRSRVVVAPGTAQSELEALALADAKIKEHTDGRQIVKIIVVPNRLVNVVVKG
jgi:leucyl-tRNA synthetase